MICSETGYPIDDVSIDEDMSCDACGRGSEDITIDRRTGDRLCPEHALTGYVVALTGLRRVYEAEFSARNDVLAMSYAIANWPSPLRVRRAATGKSVGTSS